MWSFNPPNIASINPLDAMKYSQHTTISKIKVINVYINFGDYCKIDGEVIWSKDIKDQILEFGKRCAIAAINLDKRLNPHVPTKKDIKKEKRGVHIEHLSNQLNNMTISAHMFCAWAATEFSVRLVDKEEKMNQAWKRLGVDFERMILMLEGRATVS